MSVRGAVLHGLIAGRATHHEVLRLYQLEVTPLLVAETVRPAQQETAVPWTAPHREDAALVGRVEGGREHAPPATTLQRSLNQG